MGKYDLNHINRRYWGISGKYVIAFVCCESNGRCRDDHREIWRRNRKACKELRMQDFVNADSQSSNFDVP